MGNKFTASVMTRLEQEQKTQPKQKAQSKTIEKKDKPKEKEESQEVNTSADNSSLQIPDISQFLNIEPQRTAKNKTFYLDVDVIDALCSAARHKKVTDSKLCNDILRRVLGL